MNAGQLRATVLGCESVTVWGSGVIVCMCLFSERRRGDEEDCSSSPAAARSRRVVAKVLKRELVLARKFVDARRRGRGVCKLV
jgi:hypothetical protein